MQTSEKQQEQQRELHTKLWAIANDLRGNMEANEFKKIDLIINRIKMDMVKRGDMMSAADVVDVPVVGHSRGGGIHVQGSFRHGSRLQEIRTFRKVIHPSAGGDRMRSPRHNGLKDHREREG